MMTRWHAGSVGMSEVQIADLETWSRLDARGALVKLACRGRGDEEQSTHELYVSRI